MYQVLVQHESNIAQYLGVSASPPSALQYVEFAVGRFHSVRQCDPRFY